MLQRQRLRFTFWLDVEKPEEEELASRIVGLKGKRQFAKTARDGIRLVVDLSQGKTDVLFELFPWVFDRVQADGGVSDNVLNDAAGLLMEKLTYKMFEQDAIPITATSNKLSASQPRPELTLNDLPQLQAKKVKSSGKSRQNLLDAMSLVSKAPKITLKPEAKKTQTNNIIAGSTKPLSEPTFDSLEI